MDRTSFLLGLMVGTLLTMMICMIVIVSTLPVPVLEQAGEP